MRRPYLYTSYVLGAVFFPFIFLKALVFEYSGGAVQAMAIFGVSGAFCWIHIFAAR
jgi:hypothetical protein